MKSRFLVSSSLLVGAVTGAVGAFGAGSVAAETPLFADGFESEVLCGWSDGLPCLSDGFDDETLTGWSILNPGDGVVTESGGELHLAPDAFTLWHNASTSLFVWREATGDFKVSAHVRTTRLPPNDGLPPEIQYRLGGLMLRAPSPPSGEDYVFEVVGSDVNDLSVEAKSTDDGVSTFDGTPQAPGGVAELRVCRIGIEIRYLYRLDDGAWVQHGVQGQVDRPDLPATLQFGALAYANQASGDLLVSFDSIQIRPATVTDDCFD